MDSLNIPLAVYDAVAILVPGAVLPAVLGAIYPDVLKIYGLNGWLLLAASFAGGHIVQTLSKLVDDGSSKLLPPKGYIKGADEQLRRSLYAAINQFYGQDWARSTLETHGKDLCYSVVWNRMDNYKIFTSLADLYRGLAVLSVAVAVEFGLRSCGWIKVGFLLGLGDGLSLGLGVAFLLLTLFLLGRFRFFRKLSELVVYHSFLAFVAEKRDAAK